MTAHGATRGFLRLFAVQGSWNYRTNTGTGFAFALLPILRRLHGGDAAALARSLDRHVDHFNAHPYLTGLALGAVARMEAEGADPDEIDQFKAAIRAPLGSLGDRLVWSLWLPATALIGLACGLLTNSALLGVVAFLAPYNVLHLVLRVWAFRTGLSAGRAVSPRLQRANLGGWAARATPLLALGCGLTLGALGRVGSASPSLVPFALAAVAFWVGSRWGTSLWRPVVLLFCLGVVTVHLAGVWR